MMMNRFKPALRRSLPAAIALLVAILVPALPGRAEDVAANEAALVHRLLPTVVNIAVRKSEAASPTHDANVADAKTDAGPTIKSYIGSGFVIDPSGLVVTNYHVVEDAFEITVTFSDGSRLAGKMQSASRVGDLAIVKVDADHPLPAAHWGDSDALEVGDQVLAAGDPFGIGLSISAGIVSGLNRNIGDSPYDDFIQTDATINHGNSGGPLFNMQGDVVGVDTDLISPTAGSVGLGFAIPSHNARFVIDQLRTYGGVHPGWIGVKVQAVTPHIAAAIGMKQAQGSIVSWVMPDGPAQKAGLQIGDVILRYNGATPTDDRALLRSIVETPVGKTSTLAVQRNGNVLNLPVTVEAWPRNQWEARDAPSAAQQPKIIVPPDLGLSLAPLSADERTKLGVEPGLNGVLVTKVAPDSDTARQGMASGDVILRVQNMPVATPAEVQSGIDAARLAKRDFLLMLVLPKVRNTPGPKWMALKVTTENG